MMAQSAACQILCTTPHPLRVFTKQSSVLGDIHGDGEAAAAKELVVFANCVHSYRGKIAGFYKTITTIRVLYNIWTSYF